MWTLPRGVWLLLLGAALTGCMANSSHSSRSSGDKPSDTGQPAPNIVGTDADGERFQLSDYRGKVVLLDFWASW